jgi:hypothetical protein
MWESVRLAIVRYSYVQEVSYHSSRLDGPQLQYGTHSPAMLWIKLYCRLGVDAVRKACYQQYRIKKDKNIE